MTTSMPPVESAENTRRAMLGAPAMPSPTTATTAMPGRAVTLSISPAFNSSRNAARKLATARSASPASGTVNPIPALGRCWRDGRDGETFCVDCDECPCRYAVDADHALPGDGHDRLAAHDRDCLDRIGRERALRGDFGTRLLRVYAIITSATARSAIGMSARGCRTFAP